jgi:hypothetical protein
MRKMILYLFGIIVLIAICVLFIVGLRIWHKTTLQDQLESQEAAMKVVSDLRLGMTKPQVYAVFETHHWTSWGDEGGEIRMCTKPQPLPTNWIIRLIFDGDKLSAIKYGLADNIFKHPENAPADIE